MTNASKTKRHCCTDTHCTLQLVDDLPGVSLAVSLHAPNQELRQSIVPSARAYPLPKLMAALETYLDRSRQQKVSCTMNVAGTQMRGDFLASHLLC